MFGYSILAIEVSWCVGVCLTLKISKMKKIFALLFLALWQLSASGQSELLLPVGTNYQQNFDELSNGLPPGWSVYQSATSGSVGVPVAFSSSIVSWANLTGGFRNVASATGLSSTATAIQQAAHPNRALGWRLTNSFGDPGASIVFKISNTLFRESLSFSVDHLLLDPQGREYSVVVQYSVDEGQVWQTLGSFTLPMNADSRDWGSTSSLYSLGADANNQSTPVWIRFAVLSASSGSGSRDVYAIDNFSLSWNIMSSSCPANLPAPTQASIDSVGYAEAFFSWTGHPCTDYFLVVAKEGAGSPSAPIASSYTANSVFGLGSDLGNNSYVVYASNNYQAELHGLQPGTTYTLAVYAFDGNAWSSSLEFGFSALNALTHYYTGGGAPGVWDDLNNWTGGRIPAVFDTVILDNSLVSGPYQIDLPARRIDLTALYVRPTDSIFVKLPSSNTFGLHLSAQDSGLVISEKGVFINEAGSMSGGGFFANSWLIKGGGIYIHNTNRATATLISTLIKTQSDYRDAIWVYGAAFSGTPSMVNQIYPSLHILGNPQPFAFSSVNPVTIQGDFFMGENTSYTFSMRTIIAGDMHVAGTAIFTNTVDYALRNLGGKKQLWEAPGLVHFLSGTKVELVDSVEFGGNFSGDYLEMSLGGNLLTNGSSYLRFGNVKVQGHLEHHGVIELAANDTFYGMMEHYTVSGSGSVVQSMYLEDSQNEGARWYMVGAASEGLFANVADSGAHFNFSNPSQSVLFSWDAGAGDYSLPSDSTFERGRGYMLFAGTTPHGTFTRALPGVIQAAGPVTDGMDLSVSLGFGTTSQSITVSGVRDGWNLISNPFYMTYDWHDQNIPNHVEGTIYIRNADNSGFKAVGVTETDDSRYIPPMQAFWIRANTLGTGGGHQLVFKSSSRVWNRERRLKRLETDPHLRFKFKLENEVYHDEEWVLGFHVDATEGFDHAFDGHKMANDPSRPSLYAASNAILYLPPLDSFRRIPLTVYPAVNGNVHQISLLNDYGNGHVGLWLEDVDQGVFHDLRVRPFSWRPSQSDTLFDRFVLHVGAISQPELSTEEPSPEEKFRSWVYEKRLFIDLPFSKEIKLKIFDVTGREVANFRIANEGLHEFSLEHLPKGVYLLQNEGKAVRIVL